MDALFVFGLETWGEAKAVSYLDGLSAKMNALARRELSGTSASWLSPGLCRLVSGSHVIWFRIDGDVLRVIRVLHQSRDAGRWVP